MRKLVSMIAAFGPSGVGTLTAVLVLSAASMILEASPARAVPITYTETDTASGSLNGVAFTNATIVLTMNNDTTNITRPSLRLFRNVGTAIVSINGGTPLKFTDSIAVFSNQTVSTVGFQDLAGFFQPNILDDRNPSFATYALNTAIGPITGSAVFNPGFPFSTSGGAFILTSVGNPTFTATLGTPAVPEPSSLAILASAVVGLGFFFRHSRRRVG